MIFLFKWFLNEFNRIFNKRLTFFCILSIDYQKYNMKFLFDINIIDYVFINEKIARLVCQKLKIVFIRFSYSWYIRCFNEKNVKSIIYVIYSILTMQNYKKITIFLFIIKINERSLILELFWFNKHQLLLNEKNNSLYFKLEKYNHENNSFKKIVKIICNTLK